MKKILVLIVLSLLLVTACTPDNTEPDVNIEDLSFIEQVRTLSQEIELNNMLRESFNEFGKEYKLIYLPQMNMYESFFDDNELYPVLNFGEAVFYTLMHSQPEYEKISKDDMQQKIQDLFLAEGQYKDMPHQNWGRFAKYENGYYMLHPEGKRDPEREFYLLTAVEVVEEDSGEYVLVEYSNYYFNDTDFYEPGENEIWLQKKANELELGLLETAKQLTISGEISELDSANNCKTKLIVLPKDENEKEFKFVTNICH